MADNCLRKDVNGGKIVPKGRCLSVNPHADEFDEAEWRLRQDIEEAIEQATDCIHDATEWWSPADKGPRTIETLIGMIVVAAKEFQKALEVQRIPQIGDVQ